MNTTALEDLCWAAIDFESAGTAPGNRSRPVRWSAARVHGITTDMLRGAPAFPELWPQIRDLLRGAVVLGHNPATEKRFLKAFPGHGFGPWVDTLALARQAAPDLPDHALSTLCEALGITHQVERLIHDAAHARWHDALFDAAGSLQLLRTLVQALGMQRCTLHDIDFCVSR